MKTAFTALFAVSATLTVASSASAQFPIHQHGGPTIIRVAPPVTTHSFGTRRHLDSLGKELQVRANDVTWEMYRRYQHNPDFAATYSEMHELLQEANHLQELIHDHAFHHFRDVDHIAADLHEIDQLLHHIQDDIVGWTPSHHSHHFSRAHGNLFTKMEQLEDALHHLMEDYGVHSRINEGTPPAPTTGLATPPRF